MQISGFIKNSFVDYPGHIACTIFTPHCNFDCFYCHNRELIDKPKLIIKEEVVLDFLEKRKNDLEGVVISGGEPTIQNDLKQFIYKVKAMGYKVKLDTNGSNPNIVNNLIEEKLLNFIAMDYKAPRKKYKEICGLVDENNILETLNIIKKSGVDYQIRTTLCPTLTKEDIIQIKKEIGDVKSYVVNKYRIPECYKSSDEVRINLKPINIEEINE